MSFGRVLVERDVPVPVRDGTVLRADVYHPDAPGQFPVLMERTPYDKRARARPGVLLDALRFAESGFVVVVQDTRGRFTSGGTFYPFRAEAVDGADSVAWAAALPYGNGRVGLFGASYAGATQWLAASQRPPALRAIAPAKTSTSYYEPWAYQGGVLQLGFLLHWALSSLAPDTARRLIEAEQASPQLSDLLAEALVDLEETARERPLLAHGRLAEAASQVMPYLRDWLSHPTNDGYWQALSVDRDLEAIRTPSLHIGGWYDIFLQGTLRAYARGQQPSAGERRPQRLLIGPWAHGPYNDTVGDLYFGPSAAGERANLGGQLRHWFQTWLDESAPVSVSPGPVRIFVMGANVWRDEQEWPLERAVLTPMYLRAGGGLSLEPPSDEPPDHYVYDPADPVPTIGGATLMEGHAVNRLAGPKDQRPLEARSDVLVYSTPPLERAVEVTGPLMVRLYASTTGEDTDWVAWVIDVHPDGYAALIADGILRARYREGPQHAAYLEPERVYCFEVDLVATSNVFLPGHRIRLHISSSSFPRFAPNPNVRVDNPYLDQASGRVVLQTIHHDTGDPSCILLPIVRVEA